MSDDKTDLEQKTKQTEEEEKAANTSEPKDEKPKKKKYIFNCTKCGECCKKREFVPVSFADIRNWTANGTINSVFPHLKIHTFPAQVGGETREAISLVLAGAEKGCPMFDHENKLCNIYHSMPLECKAFPLGFNGQNYVVKDKSVPGLGIGTMTKEQLISDRDNARLDYEAKVETQMLLPLTYSLFMKNLLEQQQKIRDEMPEDKRQQLEDLLKGDQPEPEGE